MSLPSTQLCLTCHGWALPGAAFRGSGLHGTVWDHVALSGTALCGLRPHCMAWEISSWLRTQDSAQAEISLHGFGPCRMAQHNVPEPGVLLHGL